MLLNRATNPVSNSASRSRVSPRHPAANSPATCRRPGRAIPTAATTHAGPSRRARTTSSRHTASRTSTPVCGASSSARSRSNGKISSGRPSNPRPSKPIGVGGWTRRAKARPAADSGDEGHDREDMTSPCESGTASRRRCETPIRAQPPNSPTRPTHRREPVGPAQRHRHTSGNTSAQTGIAEYGHQQRRSRPCWVLLAGEPAGTCRHTGVTMPASGTRPGPQARLPGQQQTPHPTPHICSATASRSRPAVTIMLGDDAPPLRALLGAVGSPTP